MSSIPRRVLGHTNFRISEIGFGAWAIGGAWGDEVPEDQAREALHGGLDAGMNFIDTADIYGEDGRSERIVGSVLKERNEPVHVATKMGRGEGWTDDEDGIARAAEGSIRRLGVGALDLVQLHCIPFEQIKAGKVFENLEKVKDRGLIRHYGASVETMEEALFCIRETPCVTLQVIFNLFRQRLVTELLPAAKANNVGIIVRVPLASGVLSGKFTNDHQFGAEDHRGFNANGECFNVGETFAGVPFDRAVTFASKIDKILIEEAPDATLAQKSLRWILDHETVSTVIPGAKTAEQARENAAASGLKPLAGQSHAELLELYEFEIDDAVRGAY